MIQLMVLIFLAAALGNREVRQRPAWNPSLAGLGVTVLAGTLFLLGGILSIKALYWGSFIILLASLFWAMSGFKALYNWLGVFIFAFFLLPEIPVDLKMTVSLPLQLLSTKMTTVLAGLMIPITSQGNIFYINGQAYEVTVACSGLHTWIGFMFAGFMWLLFEKFSLKAVVAILLGAPLLALLLNSVRLLITALVAHWVSPDVGVAIHTNLEYILFPSGLILMWLVGRRLYAAA